MTSNLKNWTVFFSSILVVGAVVLTIIEKNGTDDATAILVLRLTAYASFFIYLMLFVAGPLRQLLDSHIARLLNRNGNHFVIALAGSHTVHLALIVMFVFGTGIPFQTLLIGGVAYALLYLMLITSFDGPAEAIGPIAWRRLHKTGLYWIGGTFAFTLTNNFVANPDSLVHQVTVVLIVAAVSVRVVAFLKRERS